VGGRIISIRQSLEELEQREERERLLRECFAAAIRSTREYAVEIEAGLAERFRQRLASIERDLAAARLEECPGIQTSFRGELRVYRDRCQELVDRLRNQVASAAAAMQVLSESVSSNGSSYEKELHQELHRLEEAAESDDLPAIRAAIHSSAAAIQHSFEQMQSRNNMLVVQLQDEIRSLHQAMESERKALHTDAVTGAWNQRKLAERIDQLLKLDESFGLMLLAVGGWRRLVKEYSQETVDQSLKALVAYLKERFGTEGMIGRWSDDVLAVIVEADASAVAAFGDAVSQALAGGFVAPDLDRETAPTLQIRYAFVGRDHGANAAEFYPRLGYQVASVTA